MGTDLRLMGRYYDLSNPVHEKMPYYPSSFKPKVEQSSTVEEKGFNVCKITMAYHHGTHVDAPRHISNEGTPVDELDLNKFIGEGVVLDLSFKEIGSGISANDLETFSDSIHPNSKYTYLDKSGAEWLVKKGAKSVGIDFFSIDKYGDSANPAHSVLLGNGVPLIEEISCEAKHLLGKRIFLICLPIKMKTGDGAPARVIAYALTSL